MSKHDLIDEGVGGTLERRKIPSTAESFSDSVGELTRLADVTNVSSDLDILIAGRVLSLEPSDITNGAWKGTLADGTAVVEFTSDHSLEDAFGVGDIIEARARVMDGSRIWLHSGHLRLLTHSRLILPTAESWATQAVEVRREQPELDMLLQTRRGLRLIKRSNALQYVRSYMAERGFREVDTPILVPWPDIAPVEPVGTKEGRFAREGDLRIANTEFMRRLLVAGFDRVYQLGRCFRDEAPSHKHMVEFTQLTFGISYADYTALMRVIEDLVLGLLHATKDSDSIDWNGRSIDMTPPWARVTVRDAFKEETGIDLDLFADAESLRERLAALGMAVPDDVEGYGGILAHARLVDSLIDRYVIPAFRGPTWLQEYPYYLGGPAKEILQRPAYKMRAELFIDGIEIANISVPQNDSDKVRQWYYEMRRLKIEQGWETPHLDEPYLTAMDLGIPVCATGGLGFDRLLMMLLGADDIRDVMFFPSGAQYA